MINFDFIFPDAGMLEEKLPDMFHILYSNMNIIMPTGNSYDEDFAAWMTYAVPTMQEKGRKVVLFYADGKLVGYFQYSLNMESGSLFMEEMQIRTEYQGSGLFSAFYSWLVRQLPDGIQTVEAHAGKTNYKSQAVSEHLGLRKVGENRTGKSYHYKGDYAFLLQKYI
jgi:RimJ/RimL family protein N-acetyltransferase